MTHIDDDTLLKFALDALPDEAATAEIKNHLADCDECRSRLDRIRSEVNVISGIRPTTKPLIMPHLPSRPARWVRMMRVAAVFAGGIVVGLGASNWTHQEPVCVSPAYFDMLPASSTEYGPAPADATEVRSCQTR